MIMSQKKEYKHLLMYSIETVTGKVHFGAVIVQIHTDIKDSSKEMAAKHVFYFNDLSYGCANSLSK